MTIDEALARAVAAASGGRLALRRIRHHAGPTPFSNHPSLEVRLTGAADPAGAATPPAKAPAGVAAPPAGAGDYAHLMIMTAAGWAAAAMADGMPAIAAPVVRRIAPDALTLAIGCNDPAEALLSLAAGFAAIGVGDVAAIRDDLARRRRPHRAHFQTAILAMAARANDIPMVDLGLPSLRQFGWGAQGSILWEDASDRDGVVGHIVTKNKAAAKRLFRQLALPVARSVEVGDAAGLEHAAATIGFPCAVKPLDRGGGKGVTAGVADPAGLATAFQAARGFTSGPVLVERHVAGDDHRLMVVGGRLVAAIRRTPPTVTGDGVRSVRALVDALNAARRADPLRRRYQRQVTFDPAVLAQLAAHGIAPDDVPVAGRVLPLRSNANLSTGGDCTDMTGMVHPDIAAAAVAIAATLGIDCAGVDYMTTDITRPAHETGGAFIEINTTPGLDAVAAAGIDAVAIGGLILGDRYARVPALLVVVPEPDQPSLLATLEALDDPGHGWLCGVQAQAGGRRLDLADRAPPARVATLLQTRATTALTIVWSAADILRYGLPLDRFTAATIADPLPDAWVALVARLTAASPTATSPAQAIAAFAATFRRDIPR